MAEISDRELLEALQAVRVHGGVRSAARALNRPRDYIKYRYDKARIRWPDGRVVIRETVSTPAVLMTEVVAPQAAPEAPAEKGDAVVLRRLQNQVAELKARAKAAEERLIAAEDERDNLLRLKATPIEPVEWLAAPAIQKRTHLTPILFSSDFQLGEVIQAAEIDGMNAYNVDIFDERYHKLIESSIDLATHHTGASDYPGIIYLRGGDAISGGIHLELQDTDELSSIPAIRHLVRQEKAGIRRLKDRFGRVRVISIPGNHGRTTMKPRGKGYVGHSYETAATWWLQESFDNDPTIEFVSPASGDAFFKVYGWKCLLAHGDRMGSRGGAGFVGPSATIARGQQKLFQNWAATGRMPDLILTGHLHTSLKTPWGYANGSVAGYSEYARDIQARPDAAKQWLLFAHEKRCISQAFEVQLSERPLRSQVNAEV